LRGRTGNRAFEKRLKEERGSELARECREEMRSRGKEGKIMSGWKEEKRSFFEEREVRT